MAFDRLARRNYAVSVHIGKISAFASPQMRPLLRLPLPRKLTNYFGRGLFRFLLAVQGLGAFGLITLGAMLTQVNVAHRVTRPLLRAQLARAGLRLLPFALFLSAALGLLVIGQTVSLLTRVGAND